MFNKVPFGFRKGLDTPDVPHFLTHELQSFLEIGAESPVVPLDFSSAFDRVNHDGLLYETTFTGLWWSYFKVLKKLVAIDDKVSNMEPILSGVP